MFASIVPCNIQFLDLILDGDLKHILHNDLYCTPDSDLDHILGFAKNECMNVSPGHACVFGVCVWGGGG